MNFVIVMEQLNNASESYVLPEKWCMKIKGHKDVIRKYLMSIPDFDKSFEECIQGYLLSAHSYHKHDTTDEDYSYMWWGVSDLSEEFTEITFEQFKQYVLKDNTMEKETPGEKECKFKKGDTVEALTDMIFPAEWIATPPATITVYTIRGTQIVLGVKGTMIRLTDNADLWFEDKHFKLAHVEKELIGYRLKDEFRDNETVIKAACTIEGYITFGESNICTKLLFPNNDEYSEKSLSKLKKAGVLDLWFEPVYKEQFEKGDWVIGECDGSIGANTYIGVYDSGLLMSGWIDTECNLNTWESHPGVFNRITRKATFEEIKEAKKHKYAKEIQEIKDKAEKDIEALLK